MAKHKKGKKKKQKNMLFENAETNNIKAAKNYLRSQRNYSDKNSSEIISVIKHDIPNSRKEKSKFMQGVCRMYADRELSNEDNILKLNQVLGYVSSPAHVNEYDRNLNGLTAKELIDRFSSVAADELNKDKEKLEQNEYAENTAYEIVPINSFEEAEEYAEYVDWCVTYDIANYSTYTSSETGRLFFCLKNGFQNIERIPTENCPEDEYGLSMIAVTIFPDGSCNTITGRWNHANGGTDHLMTPEKLSEIIGRNFYKTFIPYSPEEIAIREMRLLDIFADELDYISEDELDEYNSEIISVAGETVGYVICSDISASLSERLGDDKYAVTKYPSLDFVMDELYNYAEVWDSDTPEYEPVIIVRKNKEYNILRFNSESYVFDEWLINKPRRVYKHSNLALIENSSDKKSLYETTGQQLTGWHHNIVVSQTSDIGYTQDEPDGPLTIYDFSERPAKVLFTDANKILFRNGYAVVELNDGNNYILSSRTATTEDFKWVLMSDIPMEKNYAEDMTSRAFRFIGKDGKDYRIDRATLTTYDPEGKAVCRLTDINETAVKKPAGLLLTENAETNNVNAARNWLGSQGISSETKNELIRAAKHDIPNVKKERCKFMLGVIRIMFNKELTDAETIFKFNRMLGLVASPAHANEYDRNLNGLSAQEIIDRFSSVAQDMTDEEKSELENRVYEPTGRYRIMPIDTYEDAQEYADYTDWCVTYDDAMFDNYTMHGLGRFYFCIEDGFKDIPKEKTEGCPLDTYGLSMIAVSVYSDGSVNTITCRWNHDNGGNDHIMTPKQLSDVIGMNFYKTFLPWTPEELAGKEKALVDEFYYLLHHYEPSELSEFDYTYVRLISEKEDIDYDYDTDFDEDNEDEYGYDDDNDDDKTADRRIYGYIVNSNLGDIYDFVGDDLWIIVDDELEPVMDELYNEAEVTTSDYASYYSIRILVKKGKKWNWVKYADADYVFSEWLDEKPTVPAGHGNKLVLHKNGRDMLVSLNGRDMTGWCDKITVVGRSNNAFITKNNQISYVDINGDMTETILTGIKDYRYSHEYNIIEESDGNAYVYGFYTGDADIHSWDKKCPLALQSVNSHMYIVSKDGKHYYEMKAKDGKTYYIDMESEDFAIYDKDMNRLTDEQIETINSSPVNESIRRNKASLLLENAETNNIHAAKQYMRRNDISENNIKDIIQSIRDRFPNVRRARYKFLQGMCRLYTTGEIPASNTEISEFNKILFYIASDAHVNEYDRNLNNLSFNEILDRFKTEADKYMQDNIKEIDSIELSDKNYEIVPIDSYDQASKYSEYTEWCVTESRAMFMNYTNGGTGRFYFCLAPGFEDIPEEKTEGCPLDTYGLSMIAVSVNSDGSCNTITCRWNHDNGGNDHVMTPIELSKIIGKNFYKTFLPWTPEEAKRYKEKRIATFYEYAMEDADRLFIKTGEYEDRYKELIGMYDTRDTSRIKFSRSNFDYTGENSSPLDKVYGSIIKSTWCGDHAEDEIGYAAYLIINTDLNIVGDDIYEAASLMQEPYFPADEIYIRVKLNDKQNVLKFSTGEYLLDEWADHIDGMRWFPGVFWARYGNTSRLFIHKDGSVKHLLDAESIYFIQSSYILTAVVNGERRIYGMEPDELRLIEEDASDIYSNKYALSYRDEYSGDAFIIGGFTGIEDIKVWRKATDIPVYSTLLNHYEQDGPYTIRFTGEDEETYIIDFTDMTTRDESGNIIYRMGKINNSISIIEQANAMKKTSNRQTPLKKRLGRLDESARGGELTYNFGRGEIVPFPKSRSSHVKNSGLTGRKRLRFTKSLNENLADEIRKERAERELEGDLREKLADAVRKVCYYLDDDNSFVILCSKENNGFSIGQFKDTGFSYINAPQSIEKAIANTLTSEGFRVEPLKEHTFKVYLDEEDATDK